MKSIFKFAIIFFILPILASSYITPVEDIFSSLENARELQLDGKSIKMKKEIESADRKIKKLFPNLKMIESEENCKFIKVSSGLTFPNRSFKFTCIKRDLVFTFESESDMHLSNKKNATKNAIVEKFEELQDEEEFSAKIEVKNNYPSGSYSRSNELYGSAHLIVFCKIHLIK